MRGRGEKKGISFLFLCFAAKLNKIKIYIFLSIKKMNVQTVAALWIQLYCFPAE